MRFNISDHIPGKLRRKLDQWRGIQRVEKALPKIPLKEMYEDKSQKEFFDQVKEACPDPKLFVPFMSVCTLSGIRDTQLDGNPMVANLAGRWLKALWDSLDIAFIQKGLHEPHDPQAGVCYLVLEYYFKHQGDWDAAIAELSALSRRHGLKNLTPERVQYFGGKIAEMLRAQMKANEQ
jgi:hypothetical protein